MKIDECPKCRKGTKRRIKAIRVVNENGIMIQDRYFTMSCDECDTVCKVGDNPLGPFVIDYPDGLANVNIGADD